MGLEGTTTIPRTSNTAERHRNRSQEEAAHLERRYVLTLISIYEGVPFPPETIFPKPHGPRSPR